MRLTTLLGLGMVTPILLGASCSRSIDPPSERVAPPLPEDMMVFDFSQDDIGTLPAGFTADLTGNGERGGVAGATNRGCGVRNPSPCPAQQ